MLFTKRVYGTYNIMQSLLNTAGASSMFSQKKEEKDLAAQEAAQAPEAEKRLAARKVFGTICSFFATFLVSLVAMCAVALLVFQVMGIQFFTVESGSMYPKYPKDSLVFVKETEPQEIQTGDVIIYVLNSGGTLVTHRVIGVDSQNKTFTTKGDANEKQDPAPVLWANGKNEIAGYEARQNDDPATGKRRSDINSYSDYL